MNITEIRIKLLEDQADKLRAFASLTIENCLVVRDIKIIEGNRGLFVAMPSRKICDRCPSCGGKNHLRASRCTDCGGELDEARGETDERGRARLYADICHPIHQQARNLVHSAILEAFKTETIRSREEGYVAAAFDDLDLDCVMS